MGTRAQLFVGRLGKDVRTRDLEDIFNRYGRLTRCDIKVGGGPLAYAFIDYEDKRDAEDAIKYENGREIRGRGIVVEWAKGPNYRFYRDNERGGGERGYDDYRRGGGRDDRRRGGRSRSRSRSRSPRDRRRRRSRSRSLRKRSVSKDRTRSRSHDRSRSVHSKPSVSRSRSATGSRSRSPKVNGK